MINKELILLIMVIRHCYILKGIQIRHPMRIVDWPYDNIIVHKKEKQSSNILSKYIGFPIQKIFIKARIRLWHQAIMHSKLVSSKKYCKTNSGIQIHFTVCVPYQYVHILVMNWLLKFCNFLMVWHTTCSAAFFSNKGLKRTSGQLFKEQFNFSFFQIVEDILYCKYT